MQTYVEPSNDECLSVPTLIPVPMLGLQVEIGLDFSPPCAHVRVLEGMEECVSS